MKQRRTRFSFENARVHPTGQDVESAARAALLARGVSPRAAERGAAYARGCFERGCLPTIDPNDRAHGKVDDGQGGAAGGLGGWLLPAHAVPSARPRKYPRACLVEVRVATGRARGALGVVSIDTECESLGDRANRLNAAGIPVGYVGSVTGAQQQRARGPKDVATLAYVESIAAASGKKLRDLLRPATRQVLTTRERELEREASEMIQASESRKSRSLAP